MHRPPLRPEGAVAGERGAVAEVEGGEPDALGAVAAQGLAVGAAEEVVCERGGGADAEDAEVRARVAGDGGAVSGGEDGGVFRALQGFGNGQPGAGVLGQVEGADQRRGFQAGGDEGVGEGEGFAGFQARGAGGEIGDGGVEAEGRAVAREESRHGAGGAGRPVLQQARGGACEREAEIAARAAGEREEIGGALAPRRAAADHQDILRALARLQRGAQAAEIFDRLDRPDTGSVQGEGGGGDAADIQGQEIVGERLSGPQRDGLRRAVDGRGGPGDKAPARAADQRRGVQPVSRRAPGPAEHPGRHAGIPERAGADQGEAVAGRGEFTAATGDFQMRVAGAEEEDVLRHASRDAGRRSEVNARR